MAGVSIGALLLVAFVFVSTLRSVGQAPWKLASVSDDGRLLVVRFPLGPCGADFDHVETAETVDSVTIEVFVSSKIRWRTDQVCPAVARFGDRNLRLVSPLGDRLLVGCLGGSEMPAPRGSEDEVCRDTSRDDLSI